jgi:TRAP transporter 4TM/12TM fusion protein
MSEEGISRSLPLSWKVVLIIFYVLALVLAILQIFLLRPFGFMLFETAYYYCLIGFYVSLVFLIFPAHKKARGKIPWYDYILFFLCSGTAIYLAFMAEDIALKGWEFKAPPLPTILSLALWLMVLEAVRRATGWSGGDLRFSLYPLLQPPCPLPGRGRVFLLAAARYHSMSNVSMLGIPMQVVGTLLVGFMLFGVALQATGGGKFFLDFAFALMGGAQGGPAKVSVVSSALFGTMSGSVISNVLVDGPFTIPAMKKAGYPPHYAASIEAVTSTGGALMPPVMGASAFVMASFLAVPYTTVVISAIVPPSLLCRALLSGGCLCAEGRSERDDPGGTSLPLDYLEERLVLLLCFAGSGGLDFLPEDGGASALLCHVNPVYMRPIP